MTNVCSTLNNKYDTQENNERVEPISYNKK